MNRDEKLKGKKLPYLVGKAQPFDGGYSIKESKRAAKRAKVKWGKEFHDGMNVEREHKSTTQTAEGAAAIARDHLREDSHYYQKLKRMEAKWESTHVDGLSEMSGGQADAVNNAVLNQPEYPEPLVGKAGPYIGPRGGKWADAKHTIPWQAPQQKKRPKLDAEVLNVLQDHVQAAGGLGEAIESFKNTGADVDLYIGGQKIKAGVLAAELQSWKPKQMPKGEPMVTVHHSTTKEHAASMLRDGVIPQMKPWTLASSRYTAGEDAAFSPGAGLERGLYVSKPGASDSFGRVTVEMKVPKSWLSVPAELLHLGHEATAVDMALSTEHGALIKNPIPASALRELKALPIIGKWDDTKRVIKRMKPAKRIEAHEPEGPMGPAPMAGKWSGDTTGAASIQLEYIEAEPGSIDIRPSMEGMNYRSEASAPSDCQSCDHAQDSFYADSHGFMITGLRCDALRGDPMVSKRGCCDLWVGLQHAEAPGMRKGLRPSSGGGWVPVGKKGGMVRVRGTRRDYWYPSNDPTRRRREAARQERDQLVAAVRRKTRRMRHGEGREISLNKQELNIILHQGMKFALVSAGKNPKLEPNMSVEAQQRRHEKLRDRLTADGYAFNQVEGHYEGAEDTFLVMIHDTDRDYIRALGREYNQDSVIFSRGKHHEMFFTAGPDRGKSHEGKNHAWREDAEDYYTRVKHPDGTSSKFALNFNWGKLDKWRKSALFTLAKSPAGAGPMHYDQQASMPDYQSIYYQPRDKKAAEQDRIASENRRRSMADASKGKHGFHGEAPEPVLRAEPDDYVPATQYGERRLQDKAPKPPGLPPRLFARMADKPPPGFSPVQRSKKGGYVKVIGGKRVYWYPGKPWPKGVKAASEKPKQWDDYLGSKLNSLFENEKGGVVSASHRENSKYGPVIDIRIRGHKVSATKRMTKQAKAMLRDEGIVGFKTVSHQEIRLGSSYGTSGLPDGSVLIVRVWPEASKADVEKERGIRQEKMSRGAAEAEAFAEDQRQKFHTQLAAAEKAETRKELQDSLRSANAHASSILRASGATRLPVDHKKLGKMYAKEHAALQKKLQPLEKKLRDWPNS